MKHSNVKQKLAVVSSAWALVVGHSTCLPMFMGCDRLLGYVDDDSHRPTVAPEMQNANAMSRTYMRDVAQVVGVEVGPGMTASDILAAIKMQVKPVSYHGSALTDKQINDIADMIDPEVVKILRDNGKFLSSIKGKKMFVVEGRP